MFEKQWPKRAEMYQESVALDLNTTPASGQHSCGLILRQMTPFHQRISEITRKGYFLLSVGEYEGSWHHTLIVTYDLCPLWNHCLSSDLSCCCF